MTQTNAKSKSEKFPPPHQDAAVGYPLDNGPVSFGADNNSFDSATFEPKSSRFLKGPSAISGLSRRKNKKEETQMAPSRRIVNSFLPSSIRLSLDLKIKRESVSEIFGQFKRE